MSGGFRLIIPGREPWMTTRIRANRKPVLFGAAPRAHGRVQMQGSLLFVSYAAGLVEVDAGEVYLRNTSTRHSLVYRSWGFGEANEMEIPPAGARAWLAPGLWWVRNGTGHTSSGKTRRPQQSEVAWLLVQVFPGAYLPAPARPPSARSTAPLTDSGELPTLSFKDAHLGALAHILEDFLTLRPRLSPAPHNDADLKRVTGTDWSQRRSEIRSMARDAGFRGNNVDETMLAWLLRAQYLTYDMLYASEMARTRLGLIALG